MFLDFFDLFLGVDTGDRKGVFEPFGRRIASLPRRENPVASNAYDDWFVVVQILHSGGYKPRIIFLGSLERWVWFPLLWLRSNAANPCLSLV